jgi:hypothetical protein
VILGILGTSAIISFVFVLLKITNAFAFSWFLVFVPLMIGFIPLVIISVIMLLFLSAIRGWV